MARYYGVTRSEEYLAHYGIRGMRWGIKKAKVAGNMKALSKHYDKASKKLAKLNDKADLESQLKKRKIHTSRAKMAALDTAIAGGYTLAGYKGLGKISLVGTGATAAGFGRTMYNSIAAMNNEAKLSYRGHKKAVAKRDKFEREMNEAFKGTRFSNNNRVSKSSQKKKN